MTAEEKLVFQQRYEIKSQSLLRVNLTSSHSGDRVSKGMVFSVQFFDSNGEEIKHNLLNFSHSMNYLNYRYVFTGSAEKHHNEQVTVLPPTSAKHIQMKLVQWNFLTNPKANIDIVKEGQLYSSKLSESSFDMLFHCNSFWSYYAKFNVKNQLQKVGRIAVLLINYFDQNNRKLVPKIKEQLSWSDKHNSYFKYISSPNNQASFEFQHLFYPPEKASTVDVKFIEINKSNVVIEGQLPVENALQWDHTNSNGLLEESMVSHLSDSISLEKRTELSSHVSAKQHHDLLYDSHIQTGDLLSALFAVETENQIRPSKRITHRLEFITQLIRSLDVDWFPTLSSSNRLTEQRDKNNKILHLFKVTYPFESTGGSIRNLNIVESQRNAGLEPIVVTPLNYPRIFGIGEFSLEEKIRGIRHFRFDIGTTNFQSASYLCENLQLNTQLLAGLIRKENPALLHAASGYKGYELATMAKVLSDHFSIPWIYEVRSFHEHTWTKDVFYANNSWHTKQRILKENSLMHHANHVVTISESMKNALIDRGIPKDKITIVPNAVDIQAFTPGRKSKKLIKKLGIEKMKILGYISNISLREGHDILIRAIPHVLKQHPDVVLLIVGDGPEKEHLEKLVRDLGIESNIIFTGKVDHAEIQDYYRLIDLFIVPRRRDYASDLVTPLKPYEAMALEIPLVVSDRKALIEIIGEDRGFSFRTEDFIDLSRVISDCLTNPEKGEISARLAKKWLIENRTWARNAKIYQDLYSKITGELEHYG
jgi:glycosyltransferase involved in cell wall biosynthesis